jgi:hypothetical protein
MVLSFSEHISNLQAKIKSRLGFLYHNRSSFTPAAKLTDVVSLCLFELFCHNMDLVFYQIGKISLPNTTDWLKHIEGKKLHKCTFNKAHLFIEMHSRWLPHEAGWENVSQHLTSTVCLKDIWIQNMVHITKLKICIGNCFNFTSLYHDLTTVANL